MVYGYVCSTCNEVDENVVHGMNEKPEIKCKKCGAIMKRKFYPTPHIRGKSQAAGLSSTSQDILKHQADVLSETQGGL